MKNKFFLTVASTILICVAVFFVFHEPIQDIANVPSDPFRDLKGEIYLTLGEDIQSPTPNIYVYNISEGTIRPLYPLEDNLMRSPSKLDTTYKRILYLEAPRKKKEEYTLWDVFPEQEKWNFVIEHLDKNENPPKYTFRHSLVLPASPRMPAWSPEGNSIAVVTFYGDPVFHRDYSTLVANPKRDEIIARLGKSDTDLDKRYKTPDFLVPESWVIDILFAQNGVDFKTATYENIFGVQPHWSPDGTSIVFLRTDGLYQKSLTTGEEVRVLSVPYSATTTVRTKIGLSKDGTKFTWTLPFDQEAPIRVYDVVSWTPFKAVEKPVLKTRFSRGENYYWPVFSPDGKYLATQRIRLRPGGSDLESTLVVFDIESRQTKDLITLHAFSENEKPAQEFSADLTFVDDWVY